MNIKVHEYTHIQVYTCTTIHYKEITMHIYIHRQTQIQPDKHTHLYIYTSIHTETHTHTYAPSNLQIYKH